VSLLHSLHCKSPSPEIVLTIPGCRNCRRRKVKCDEKHPVCSRCLKSNQICEGYIRDHRFVDDETARQARKKTNVSPKPDSPAAKEILTFQSPRPACSELWIFVLSKTTSVFLSSLRSSVLMISFPGLSSTPKIHRQVLKPVSVLSAPPITRR
jgi:hypothetical protein